ncbi:MAG: hypothetical protein E7390_01980 [Ruminococcaceae bacterium]|nr:hypothetical protein [Oscillospiraceae bacterium]
MNTVKIEKKNTKMVAHRGLSGIECENSAAAFVAAGNRSYWGIETDVHSTADGHYVVIHDVETGKRVSDTDINVEESTLAEIRTVLLQKPDTGETRADLRIPTLQEYISICKKYGKVAVTELKTDFSEAQIAEILQIIGEMDYLDDTVFISFTWENLVKVKKLRPNQAAQFLCSAIDDTKIEELREYSIGLDIAKAGVSAALIQKIHEKGLEINCWTVDAPEEAAQYIAWGIDYITTNILE